MYDDRVCICGTGTHWADHGDARCVGSSWSCDLVYLYGAGVSYYARTKLVSKHGWRRIKRCEDLVVLSNAGSFTNGGKLIQLVRILHCVLELKGTLCRAGIVDISFP